MGKNEKIDKMFFLGILIGLFVYSFHRFLTSGLNWALGFIGITNEIAQSTIAMIILGVIILLVFGVGIGRLIKAISKR